LLSWLKAAPQIVSIKDVGNDQGRFVRIIFERSSHDARGDGAAVTGYVVLRRQDQYAQAPDIDRLSMVAGTSVDHFKALGWDYITTVPARGDVGYQVVAPTLCDSTAAGICWSTFMVSATTSDLYTYFDSESDRGYSVDNLAPAAPVNLVWRFPTLCTWDKALEPDVSYYSVYGSNSPVFDETAIRVGCVTGTEIDVSAVIRSYYYVSATDFAGNESAKARVGGVNGTSTDAPVALSFALGPAQPNPARGNTTLSFSLPHAGAVTLAVYSASGQRVCELLSGARPAGSYRVSWDGRGADGVPVPSGVYYVRFQADNYAAADRLIVIH
jgi:hypothetical protein